MRWFISLSRRSLQGARAIGVPNMDAALARVLVGGILGAPATAPLNIRRKAGS
ncbi:hypothetical protein SALB1_2228 [Salinisphaera sp. LB1]|nr:hypothetical protein SALB1_2228 [Salinisphaera sp. LB1]